MYEVWQYLRIMKRIRDKLRSGQVIVASEMLEAEIKALEIILQVKE